MKIESIQINPISADVENDRASVKKLPTQIEIQNWIVNYVAEILEVKPNIIDVTMPFDRYGIDSAEAIGLVAELNDWLAIELEPTLIYDYPYIEALARRLSKILRLKPDT